MDVERLLHSRPVNLVEPMSVVMDDDLPAKRVSTKSKAPSPPALNTLDSSHFSHWYPGSAPFTMDHKDNLTNKDLSLVVVLPDGVEKMTTVHGSKPLMDLLVTLCARYHLNPSSHTLELMTAGRHNIKLKPSALIGTLDAEKILLRPKGDDKNKKSGPHVPEATVRMVINYKKTQKTILRVNPQVPLTELLAAICEKCEFAEETTVLLRDVHSLTPLDLSCSLNDYAIRELYARDTRGAASPTCPSSPTHAAVPPGKDKHQKEKENKGLFSKFRKSKKTSEQATTASAPASPVLVSKPRPLSMALPSSTSPPLGSPTSPVSDAPKKRRAPQPPIRVSQSCRADPRTRQRLYSEPNPPLDSDQVSGLSRGSSAESSLKRTKRKAPPPPTPQTLPPQGNTQDVEEVQTLQEIMEETSAAGVQREEPSVSSVSAKDLGEDQPHDLSSDGKQPQDSVHALPLHTRVATPDGTQSAHLAESVVCQVGDEHHHHESTSDDPVSVKEERGDATSHLQESPQDAGTSVEEKTAKSRQEMEIISTSRPAGEDVEVQTELTEQALPSVEEMRPTELEWKQASEVSSCRLASPKAGVKVEPKPKASNELTRDYLPKVGMTTYTVVPPKPNEKLRYFEVALTLESPPPLAAQEGEGPHPHIPRDQSLSGTAATQDTVHGRLHEACSSPPAGSSGEPKATRTPPATKPKPGSFRMSKHKKTPGYYVTSAAEKSPGVCPASQVDNPTLPPALPAQPLEGADEQASPKRDVGVTRRSDPPSKESSFGLSLEKLRSFAAPRPYSPKTPSRFAQAVSSAVKRSHSLSRGPKSPTHSPLKPCPPPSPEHLYSLIHKDALFHVKGDESGEAGGVPGGVEGAALSALAEMAVESYP
ncbi:cordon-bleu protein-like 1b isoform X2 [Dunckerocampus dactyliophorus]|uniref:cordon-bleu protein-like 1b isoform X2 n=1 Tax=Dunckerocampus dactyliophorus TaxID=161453 RepID=UPI0024055060|nr:cordon-bleu protein-like 1b isoform X2 [Dunckerocampus dactyliophorus]